MAAALPAELKPIGHYLKIANEHSVRDPVVYYWCLVYAVEKAMGVEQKSAEATAYLGQLLTTLEQVKKTLKDEEAIASEIVAQAHIEQYALGLFSRADKDDRDGVANKNVVKLFYTAAHLFDTLSTFGDVDESIAEHCKYAKWKAAYINNCLRTGQTPIPGPMRAEGDDGDTATANVGDHHAPFQPPEANQAPQPPQQHPTPATLPLPTTTTSGEGGGGGGAAASAADLSNAQKHAKWAISAMEYEDVPTAIANLTDALRLLQK